AAHLHLFLARDGRRFPRRGRDHARLQLHPGSSGTFVARFTVTNENGNSGSDDATITVLDAPLVAQAVALTATESVATGLVPVATFTDTGSALPAGSYAALINWGDGSAATPGVVSFAGGTFTVSGDHVYTDDGSYPLQVTVSEGEGNSITVSATATVLEAPLVGQSVAV